MSWIRDVGMKRVVEVLRYVDEVVEVWMPNVRRTRSDSSIKEYQRKRMPKGPDLRKVCLIPV